MLPLRVPVSRSLPLTVLPPTLLELPPGDEMNPALRSYLAVPIALRRHGTRGVMFTQHTQIGKFGYLFNTACCIALFYAFSRVLARHLRDLRVV